MLTVWTILGYFGCFLLSFWVWGCYRFWIIYKLAFGFDSLTDKYIDIYIDEYLLRGCEDENNLVKIAMNVILWPVKLAELIKIDRKEWPRFKRDYGDEEAPE